MAIVSLFGVIRSYTNLIEKERLHAEKLVSILAKGFADMGMRS